MRACHALVCGRWCVSGLCVFEHVREGLRMNMSLELVCVCGRERVCAVRASMCVCCAGEYVCCEGEYVCVRASTCVCGRVRVTRLREYESGVCVGCMSDHCMHIHASWLCMRDRVSSFGAGVCREEVKVCGLRLMLKTRLTRRRHREEDMKYRTADMNRMDERHDDSQ